MKKYSSVLVIILLALLLSLLVTAFTQALASKAIPNQADSQAALVLQITPSPELEEDQSEIGSTDGIVILGGVIVMIVVIPILARRKHWVRQPSQ